MCLDSIYDPSVCSYHGNSQRLRQDGKLHYHKNIFCVPLHLPASSSPPHPLSLHPSPSLFPHSLLLESVHSAVPCLSFLFVNLSFKFSFSPQTPLSLCLSTFLSKKKKKKEKKKVHWLRKLKSLYTFLPTPAPDTFTLTFNPDG